MAYSGRGLVLWLELMFVLYWVTVALNAVAVFYKEYASYDTEHALQQEILNDCESRHRTHELFGNICQHAKVYVATSSTIRAWETAIAGIHSCGHISCKDALLPMVNSTAGLCFMFSLATLFLFICFQKIEYFRAINNNKKEKSSSRRLYYDEAEALPEGSTAFSIEEINRGGQRMLSLQEVNPLRRRQIPSSVNG